MFSVSSKVGIPYDAGIVRCVDTESGKSDTV